MKHNTGIQVCTFHIQNSTSQLDSELQGRLIADLQ